MLRLKTTLQRYDITSRNGVNFREIEGCVQDDEGENIANYIENGLDPGIWHVIMYL